MLEMHLHYAMLSSSRQKSLRSARVRLQQQHSWSRGSEVDVLALESGPFASTLAESARTNSTADWSNGFQRRSAPRRTFQSWTWAQVTTEWRRQAFVGRFSASALYQLDVKWLS